MILVMALLPSLMGSEGIYWSGPITELVGAAVGAVLLVRGMRSLKPGAEPGLRAAEAV